MNQQDDGMAALVNAARLELARVYSQPCREHRSYISARRDPMLEEVHHFTDFGWSTKRVALRLGISRARVEKILAA